MIKRSDNPKKLGGQRNQCPSCLEYFNTNAGFDAHRTGSHTNQQRRCLSVEEIEGKGLKLNVNGFWTLPVPEKDVERLANMRKRKNAAGKPGGNAV